MTLHRFAAKRDHLEPAIIAALREMGVGVIPVSARGAMDLACWCREKGWVMVEVKSAQAISHQKKLTAAQQGMHERFPICIVRTVEEAVQLFV